MSTAAPDRRDRYGGPIVKPRTARILAVIGLVLMVGVVVFVGVRFANQPATAKVTAYQHVAPDRISVTIQVTKRPGVPTTCAVQAMNKGAAQVGFIEAAFPASPERQVARTFEISTQGEAVSAEVLGCSEEK